MRSDDLASDRPTLRDIFRARSAIAPWIRRTPLVPSPTLAHRAGVPVFLKLETLQDTGSFKIRGATNRLLASSGEQRARGVATVSTGNHGRAVAYAAKRLGLRAVVCMSSLVPRNKVDAIRELGAEVRIFGESQDEAQAECNCLVAQEGLMLVPPFDDPYVIAGQGTIGLELLEELPAIDAVLVPLSGGGLISGIALALKSAAPNVRVVGVSMERGAAMHESQRAGQPVRVTEWPSLADSLGGGIGLDNRYTFSIVREYVDDIVLVDEGQIAAAMVHAYRHERMVAEGAAVVGIAALVGSLAGSIRGATAIVITGHNVDMDAFCGIVCAGGPRQTSV